MPSPPYKFISDELKANKVIPFLGSWASLAGVPVESSNRLPDGKGLTKELIKHFGMYPGKTVDPLMKVAQFCEECLAGRAPLYTHLRERFFESQAIAEPPPLAKMLAEVQQPLIIITTNYDSYVESAYNRMKRPYTLLSHVTNRDHPMWGSLLVQRSINPENIRVVEPSDLLLSDYASDTIIYKIHGTFGSASWSQYDTIIITENDYVDFIVMTVDKKFPPAIAKEIQQRHILFLGYALEDWNFRVILRRIQLTAALGPKYKSWAIQKRPSKIEKEFWQKREVAIFDVDLAEFVIKLKALL